MLQQLTIENHSLLSEWKGLYAQHNAAICMYEINQSNSLMKNTAIPKNRHGTPQESKAGNDKTHMTLKP